MKITNISILIQILILTLFSPLNLVSQNCAKNIINDMQLPADSPLHGTDTLSWGMGNSVIENLPIPAKNKKGEFYKAITNWGQVYISRAGSSATNTRCQIKNVVTKILQKDGKWITVQFGSPTGAAFREDFANNYSIDAGIKDETNNGGGISIKVGVCKWKGYNFHFWTAEPARVDIDVTKIVAVYTSCQARLIIEDPNKQDDRAQCKNLMQMGADWWLNKTTGWKSDWTANSGIAGGRSRWIKNEWQTYSMCTLKPEQIIANPPCEN